jgi:hypothetical protein
MTRRPLMTVYGSTPRLRPGAPETTNMEQRRYRALPEAGWLGPQSVIALTKDELPTTDRTPLNITTKDVELSLDGTTVVARLPVGSPILSFFAVTDTLTLNAPDYNRGLQLCRVNLLAHGLRSGLTRRSCWAFLHGR